METIEYTRLDKAKLWGDGPWVGEPDKVQYPDPETGLPCLLLRNPMGNWCGYVGVEKGHPLHGVDYWDRPELEELDVHGGVTYSCRCEDGKNAEQEGICHVPAEGEAKDVWWFGFDCSHYLDLVPSLYHDLVARGENQSPLGQGGPTAMGDGIYRDLVFVKAETAGLAAALAKVRGK